MCYCRKLYLLFLFQHYQLKIKMSTIYEYKESNKKKSEIKIPNGVIEIDEYAFLEYSLLTNVTIPKSIEVIGDCAFDDEYEIILTD